MKKGILLAASALCAFTMTSCLTVNAKKIVEAPYVPAPVAGVDLGEVETLSKVYFSKENVPTIDGNFSEWKGLEGVHTRKQVYGGAFNPVNADGLFVCRTDGDNLYLYADITDNDAGVNTYAAGQAWRGDSVEYFFGTDTSKHTSFKATDFRVRIAPRSKTDKFDVLVALNDNEIQSSDVKVAIVYDQKGYKVEGVFPLSLFGGKTLKLNQKVRADFQINDADDGKERTGLLHWNCAEDNTYANPSGWGDGKVVALPQ